jgi:FtsZ-interacting cell division protein ZipA
MRISSLQLGLIVAGAVLIVGVLVYNMWVMRRARARMRSATVAPAMAHGRVEPSIGASDSDRPPPSTYSGQIGATLAREPAPAADDEAGDRWEIPLGDAETLPAASMQPVAGDSAPSSQGLPRGTRRDAMPQPDPDIESVIIFQPPRAIAAAALAPGMHTRLGKPVRWFGRREPVAAWQRLTPESTGEWVECATCLLLADRSGAASRGQVDAFVRMASELAPTLPAAFTAPVVEDEVARAEALDRLCAELDMQIGITIQKTDGAPIAGTRLRGVAEAAGFRLAPNGRYEWVLEDNGAVLYTLQNLSGEPFTNDMLRAHGLSGIVFVLDVPCVAEPARAFDQMKLAAARLARTLGGEMVDDNRRPLAEEALARTRAEVAAAGAALARVHIEPGSPRALKLFSA